MGSARSEVTAARQREIRRALALAVVPLAATLLLGMLLVPRVAMPDALPLPLPDPKSLQQTFEADSALAARGRSNALPGVVRALGSALRAFHALELKGGQPDDLANARRAIDTALIDVQSAGDEPLLELRAVQLEAFTAEVDRFVSTGVESTDLGELGGGFVRTMRGEGWCDGHRLTLTRSELRTIFKQMWSSVIGVEDKPPFALTLDEKRVLFALRLSRPHLPGRVREAIATAKQGAKTDRACKAIEQSEQKALERWSLDRIEQVAAIDPLYPAEYARGVAKLRGGNVEEAADSFREWLSVHPDGALALRARSYLRLATRAAQVE